VVTLAGAVDGAAATVSIIVLVALPIMLFLAIAGTRGPTGEHRAMQTEAERRAEDGEDGGPG
jgi:hypothetical protein